MKRHRWRRQDAGWLGSGDSPDLELYPAERGRKNVGTRRLWQTPATQHTLKNMKKETLVVATKNTQQETLSLTLEENSQRPYNLPKRTELWSHDLAYVEG